MNFAKAGISSSFMDVAVHNRHTRRPIARHAYRLSQVITYGVVAPQTFVH